MKFAFAATLIAATALAAEDAAVDIMPTDSTEDTGMQFFEEVDGVEVLVIPDIIPGLEINDVKKEDILNWTEDIDER